MSVTKNINKFCKTLNTKYLERIPQPYKNIIGKYIKELYYDNKISSKVIGSYKVIFKIFFYFFYYPKVKIVHHSEEYKLKWKNSGGFIATNLNIPGVDKFELQLLEAVNKWFQNYLWKEYTFKDKKTKKLYTAKLEEKEKKKDKYNISNKKNLKILLDSKLRKKYFTPVQELIILKAFSGGGNAQFTPWLGWRLSGFGIWNHLRGFSFILTHALPEILKQYYNFFPYTLRNNSIPHLIYKPPSKSSGKLMSHFDDGACIDMYQRCLNCETISEWVDTYGVQTLAHLKGGLSGGQTNFLGPMDTHTYLIILQMIHPKTIHPEMPKPKHKTFENWDQWWISGGNGGPVFYDWYNPKILKIINRVLNYIKTKKSATSQSDKIWVKLLKENGYYDMIVSRAAKSPYIPLRKIDMLPKIKKNPYLIIWLKGFIHGSNVTGDEPRLTLTITYDPKGNKKNATRALNRLKNIANKNFSEVIKDKEPYEGGHIHKTTKTEVDLYKFFGHMYITPTDIPQIEKYFIEYSG